MEETVPHPEKVTKSPSADKRYPIFINKVGECGHFQLGRTRRNILKGELKDSNRTYALICAFHSPLHFLISISDSNSFPDHSMRSYGRL